MSAERTAAQEAVHRKFGRNLTGLQLMEHMLKVLWGLRAMQSTEFLSDTSPNGLETPP